MEDNEKQTLNPKNQRKHANDSLAEEIASIMTYNLVKKKYCSTFLNQILFINGEF